MSTSPAQNASVNSLTWTSAFAALIALFSLVSVANADVITVGVVDPIPPAAGGVFPNNSELIVGDGDDDTEGDIWGYVSIDDGTLLQYGSLIVGDNDGYFGQINVDGNFLAGINTQLNFSALGSGSNPTVQIGHEGTGWLNVKGGSTMTLTNSSGDMSIGSKVTGVGYTTISDRFTILTVGDNLFVGQNGIGNLDVLSGAIVRTLATNASSFIGIGTNAFGVGTVHVDGVGSVLRSGSNLVVSGSSVATPTEFGQGTLRISNGGIVDVDNGVTFSTTPRIIVGPRGRIELDGGTLIGYTPISPAFGITVNGYLGGSGLVRGSVELREGSFVEANPTDLLRFSGNVSNQGAITINNGEVWFLSNFTNNAPGIGVSPGRISLENGTVRFTASLTNNGVISSASGSNNIHGEITNNERIFVARDSVATFYDTYTENGTLTILPGGNALFLANLSFQAASVLELGIGAASLGEGESPLSSTGAMTLDGNLTIDLDSGYTPSLGQSYELLSADGGIIGTFDNITLPALPDGLEFGVLYSLNSVMMEVRTATSAVGVPGDYNNDGFVDASDYTVWRNKLGSSTALPNDDTPGVGQDDYARWKANFGLSAGAGAIAGLTLPLAAPEPTTFFLSVIGFLGLLYRRRSSARA